MADKAEVTAAAGVTATPGEGGASSNGVAAAAVKEAADSEQPAEEEFEEGYEEEAYDEEMEYAEEEGYENGGAEFEINATDAEAQDFGEGQEEDMLEDVRTKIREMEEEADKLRQLQSDTEKQPSRASLSSLGEEATAGAEAEKLEVDSRSVYVGQVEYSCTIEELDAHFRGCGVINRITIMCDRFSGHPKGFAYIEFATKEAVEQAVLLNDSTLKERQLKVIPKRTNQPGLGFAARRARRPFRGASFTRGRRPYRGYSPSPYYRGRSTYRGGYRGGAFRPRRPSRFMAY
ncbi:putative Polyadenylate-binding protein 2 [Hypsibius exemplaris]|uniref:Polyadenylate-binding protein 2 n=1 Tax=Hypsibius exemplaris TaxID=2072580 RepID=A0A1W0WPZ5_HYPEX|nr:putative Polyadenylate-binding protein 2 [Hypsibius exemplaris]